VYEVAACIGKVGIIIMSSMKDETLTPPILGVPMLSHDLTGHFFRIRRHDATRASRLFLLVTLLLSLGLRALLADADEASLGASVP
jgi:hypothetical protein